MNLPLVDGTEWTVPPQFQQELCEVYQGVNIAEQLAKMRGWLLCNPARRKTRAGIKRFVGNWLAKACEQAPKRPVSTVTCCDCSAPATERVSGASYCARHAVAARDWSQRIAAQRGAA